jgi:hypothetical protein
MDEFGCVASRQLGQRHVVRDPGVIHQQIQRFGGTDFGNAVDGLAGGKVRDRGPDLRFGVRVGELRQPFCAPADDHQVVAVRGQSFGVCPADSRSGSGDKCELAHDVSFQTVIAAGPSLGSPGSKPSVRLGRRFVLGRWRGRLR